MKKLKIKTFRLIHFGVGVDGFYDGSIEPRMVVNDIEFKEINAFFLGVHFNQTLNYDRFSFTLQEGLYLNRDNEIDEKIMFNRVIFNYDISNYLSCRLAFRTYLHDLRYLEPGITFRW